MALWVMPRKGRKVFFSEEKKQKTFIFPQGCTLAGHGRDLAAS
jgi:hypothetical protein